MEWVLGARSRGAFLSVMLSIVLASPLLAVPATRAEASAAEDVSWTETTLLSGDKYQNLDLEIGKRHIYIMTWEYYTGPVVMLQRSDSWGKEWSAPTDVFGEGVWNAFPAMCCYENRTHDELIIAAGEDYMVRSHDEGQTFEPLSPLPVPEGCQDWRYMAVGTNASWFGGRVDPDIYVLGALYVGEYWTGIHRLAFTKSTDWGNTWSEPVFLCPDEEKPTNYPEVVSDGSRLYVAYTKINVSLQGSEIALKHSDDWGATWSEEVPIPLPRPVGIGVTGFQYVDEDRAIMTVFTNYPDDTTQCTGKIGYFHFSNLTYQVLCELTGPEWCIAAGTFEGELARNGVYHVAWAYEPVLQDPMELKYAWTRDISFPDMSWEAPLVMGNPPERPDTSGAYNVTLHGTESDEGDAAWDLRSNGDWVHHEAGADGSCEVGGTPTENGTFWVNLTVSDGDSSESFNWTVSVTQAIPGEPDDGADDPAPDEEPDDDVPAGTDGTVETLMLAAAAVACGTVVVASVLFLRRRGGAQP
jgi:hypothetical protein